ncbi:MAG: DNA alkylation repair protein, partial [Clostridium sp.]|nr:DNA alkylation repair protein [Clostridium sp.]
MNKYVMMKIAFERNADVENAAKMSKYMRNMFDFYGLPTPKRKEVYSKHEYLGHTVNFKTRKHFKDKKSHYVDKDQW